MVVYHGSNRRFKSLRISKSLVNGRGSLENEGLGIYFSTDRDVACSYGKYVYRLYVNSRVLKDFRKKSVCRQYVHSILSRVRKETGVNPGAYIDTEMLVRFMKNGAVAISSVGREIYMLLDANGQWFELPSSKIEKVYTVLKRCDKNCPKAYLFNYSIRGIGVIKDVSEDVVIIDEREDAYQPE